MILVYIYTSTCTKCKALVNSLLGIVLSLEL